MNEVIIIFEIIPENTFIYRVLLNNKDFEFIKKCHNRYLNTEGTEDIEELSDWIEQFNKNKIFDSSNIEEKSPPVLNNLTKPITIVVTGFVL